MTNTNLFDEVIFDSILIKLTTKKVYGAVSIAIICSKFWQGSTKPKFSCKKQLIR